MNQQKILLKEVQHRVKNNLSTLSSLMSIQEHSEKDIAAKNALREMRDRANAIIRIYEQLSSTGNCKSLRLDTYIERLASDIHSVNCNRKDCRITLDLQILPISVQIQNAMPIGLILNELLTNIYKHACNTETATLKITIEAGMINDTHAAITVSDNGKGLPDGMDLEKPETLGLQLIQQLTKQINGKLDCIDCDGTSLRITFPV